MATVRPPRNGPMQRQRISEKNFWSNCCPILWSGCCAFAEAPKMPAMISPTMKLFPATLIRIRVLHEKGEDTLPTEMGQCGMAPSIVFGARRVVRMDKLVGEVAQDGGAARGDTAFGNEGEKPREKLFHVDGGIESAELGEKVGG